MDTAGALSSCILEGTFTPVGAQLHHLRRCETPLLLIPSPASTRAGLSESLPVFPHVPAASVVLKLRNREANDIFFREMGELCAAVQVGAHGGAVRSHPGGRTSWAQTAEQSSLSRPSAAHVAPLHAAAPPAGVSRPGQAGVLFCCAVLPAELRPTSLVYMQDLLTRTGPQLPPLADSLLEVAFQETGVRMGRERVLAGCRTALAAIHEGKLPATCRLRLARSPAVQASAGG